MIIRNGIVFAAASGAVSTTASVLSASAARLLFVGNQCQHKQRGNDSYYGAIKNRHNNNPPTLNITKAVNHATAHCIKTISTVFPVLPHSRLMAAIAAAQGV